LRHTGSAALLRMEGIVKDFPGVRALDHVDFEVRAGEVHALIGENGAGKSTLMNVLAGRFADYQGRVVLDGDEVHLRNPRQALAHSEGRAVRANIVGHVPPVLMTKSSV